MFIGEFPDGAASRNKVAIAGRQEQLLKALCDAAGVDIETVYISNALLCTPTIPKGKGSIEKLYPHATLACNSRLLAEISEVNPRVIVAFGQLALTALLGEEKRKNVRVPFECPECGNPPKRAKSCPGCGGYKTRVTERVTFTTDARSSFVSGGIYTRDMLPFGIPDDHALRYVIPTYAPSQLLRTAETDSEKAMYGQFFAPSAVKHLQKAKRLLTSDPVFPFSPVVTTDPEYLFEYTKHDDIYAVDIETDSADPFAVTQIRCVGIGRLGTDEVIVVPTEGLDRDHPLVTQLCAFWGDMFTPKVFQNGLYDTQVVRQVWKQETRGWVGDTLIAHAAVAPDTPHNLHHIAFTYTDASPWKPPKNKNGMEVFEDEEEFWLYNARDVRATILAYDGLLRDLKLEDVEHIHEIDMRKAHLAHEMTAVGMPVDLEEREKIAIESERVAGEKLGLLRAFIRVWAREEGYDVDAICEGAAPENLDVFAAEDEEPAQGNKDKAPPLADIIRAFNPNATAHLDFVLFDPEGPLKLYPTKTTATGQASTAKDAIKVYSDKPFVADLLGYRTASKVRRTYIDGMPLGPTGRLHAEWNPIGSRTGRWTSSPNFLNWQKHMRRMIAVGEGETMVGADFDQLELRILAALSGDLEMIQVCANADDTRKLEPEWDPHSRVAAMTFGKAFTDFDPYDKAHDKALEKEGKCPCGKCMRKALRDVTKRVVYGLNYGAQAAKIVETLQDSDYSGPPITQRMVEATVAGYFATFPGVEKYRNQILRQAQEERLIACPLSGRRRVFPLGEVSPTQVLNYPIQSCAATIVDTGLLALDEARREAGLQNAYVFAMVHDAVYGVAPKDQAQAFGTLIENTMRCTLSFHDGVPPMPITISANYANNWKDAA